MKTLTNKRITVITGHFGSGKTEIAINMAVEGAKLGRKTALVDLDIANPYFRSREQKKLLEAEGVEVVGNAYGREITADLPALDPAARRPLENKEYSVIVDLGGDDSGARILNQLGKYFKKPAGTHVFFVVNGNRPETAEITGAEGHIRRITSEIGLEITGIINNTHMLKETGKADLERGIALCESLSQKTGIPFLYSCLAEEAAKSWGRELIEAGHDIRPIRIYMRPSWLDR